jgi:hypothetical protein
MLVEMMNHPAQFDDFGAGSDDCHYLESHMLPTFLF